MNFRNLTHYRVTAEWGLHFHFVTVCAKGKLPEYIKIIS